MKKILFTFLFIFLLLPFQASYADTEANLYFFYGEGCPHCAKEEVFLDKMEGKYDNIHIYRYEVWHNTKNAKILSQVASALNIEVSGVPILIGGDKFIIGYYNDQTTGKKIEELIQEITTTQCVDQVGEILGLSKEDEQCNYDCASGEECSSECGCAGDFSSSDLKKIDNVDLPFVGQINIKDFSLPFFTILIGALDGFNPCAMWVLLFLISLLLGMKDRKKMWILGGSFIFSSGAVYFLFLSAWLNLFLFLGFIFWIRIIIGLVALGSGFYHLKEYFKNKKGTCHVTNNQQRRKVFEKLKDIVSQRNFLLALVGIVLLAGAVNLVELVCSAGLPAIYTQVLTLANLPTWQYYGYLFLYIFVFMLDDLFVFILAMITLRMQGISSKYTKWSNLIGGILMLIIGLLLIFKPGWLMFG